MQNYLTKQTNNTNYQRKTNNNRNLEENQTQSKRKKNQEATLPMQSKIGKSRHFLNSSRFFVRLAPN